MTYNSSCLCLSGNWTFCYFCCCSELPWIQQREVTRNMASWLWLVRGAAELARVWKILACFKILDIYDFSVFHLMESSFLTTCAYFLVIANDLQCSSIIIYSRVCIFQWQIDFSLLFSFFFTALLKIHFFLSVFCLLFAEPMVGLFACLFFLLFLMHTSSSPSLSHSISSSKLFLQFCFSFTFWVLIILFMGDVLEFSSWKVN